MPNPNRGYNTIYECKRCFDFVSDEERSPYRSQCQCGHIAISRDPEGRTVIRVDDRNKPVDDSPYNLPTGL